MKGPGSDHLVDATDAEAETEAVGAMLKAHGQLQQARARLAPHPPPRPVSIFHIHWWHYPSIDIRFCRCGRRQACEQDAWSAVWIDIDTKQGDTP